MQMTYKIFIKAICGVTLNSKYYEVSLNCHCGEQMCNYDMFYHNSVLVFRC